LAKKWPEMVIQWPFMSHKISFFSYKISKTCKQTNKVFYVIAFDLIKILKNWASQNDRQILSFVKAINVVGKTMTRNSLEMPNS
jgi:hypothetical protein